MADELDKTVRIQRNAKVGTDSRGRTVWTKPVETVELELVSTQMLEHLLESDIGADKARMRELADGGNGVLARDTSNNVFEIVSDDELEAALAAAGDDGRPVRLTSDFTLVPADDDEGDEPLSLVTTQVLKKMLTGDEADDSEEPGGGYNPYDNS